MITPSFRFVEHNISEPVEIDGPVDNVLHFASPASPVDYLTHPIPTLKVGSLGTHNALGLAKAKDARFLLASTSEVYGDPEVHPQREDYWGNVNPIGPRGCYDEAKRFAEAITMAYHRYHGVKTRIVRIFNTYGPRMRLNDGRVLPNFMKQALSGEPLTIYGRGEQTRSFCYVSDLVEGIVRLLKTDFSEPVNLGNPTEITVMQLAEEIIALIGDTKSKIVYEDLPQDDPKRRKPDITRAQTLLGMAARGGSCGRPEAVARLFSRRCLKARRTIMALSRHTLAPARISMAALRPLIAITLPPGCVQAPQRKTPGMGVRGCQPLVPHVGRQTFTLEDVAAGQADLTLDVGGTEHLDVDDGRRHVVAIAGDRTNRQFLHLVAASIPIAASKRVRHILGKYAHGVHARRARRWDRGRV